MGNALADYYRNNNHYRKDNFSMILNEVHTAVQNKVKENTLKEEARNIEKLLKEVKHIAKELYNETPSAVINNIDQQIANLINETFKLQVDQHSTLRQADYLFSRYHFDVKHVDYVDDIFEEELNFLLKAAAQLKGLDYNANFTIGQQNVQISNMRFLTESLTKDIINVTQEAAKKMKVSIDKNTVGKTLQIKSGKIDLQFPVFDVEANGQTFIDKLLRAFSGHTFSVKNYTTRRLKGSDIDFKDLNIKIGETVLYKAVTGALYEMYTTNMQVQNIIYFRGMNIVSGRSKSPDTATAETISAHFAHLRLVYELRGSGLFDATTGVSVRPVDFLIENDPHSEYIIVRSTKEIIGAYLEKYNNMFDKIYLTGGQLLALDN